MMIIINNTLYLTILLRNFDTECKGKTLPKIEFKGKNQSHIEFRWKTLKENSICHCEKVIWWKYAAILNTNIIMYCKRKLIYVFICSLSICTFFMSCHAFWLLILSHFLMYLLIFVLLCSFNFSHLDTAFYWEIFRLTFICKRHWKRNYSMKYVNDRLMSKHDQNPLFY